MLDDAEKKLFYATVRVDKNTLGTYVEAPDISQAFEEANRKYKRRHPHLHVETIAMQEMNKAFKIPFALAEMTIA